MGPVTGEPCERLPFPLYGYDYNLSFTRGFQEIVPAEIFDVGLFPPCNPSVRGHRHSACPVCSPPAESHYLMWVGKQYYTADEFLAEAAEMGISKRIANLPDGFQIGKSWVFLAHLESGAGMPGVILAFKPSHVDLVVDDENDVPDYADELNERLGGRLRVVKVIPDEEEDA